ncbi:hypothetical protein NPX13_g8745 [Xylaria arbuscula]|uniref:BHLH domain-containing protein n=1 Tax=Xylaria arbuscula TaxID=114810 RepID=A0A9W8N865_9PEZI|nr:hypothetical protein NPX13_g8745 [Xylaria arbuscula]
MTAVACIYRPKMGSPESKGESLPLGPFGYRLDLDANVDDAIRFPPVAPRYESNDWAMPPYANSQPLNDGLFNSFAPDLLGHSTSFGPQFPPGFGSATITGQSPVNYRDSFTFVPDIPNTIPQSQHPPEFQLQPQLQPTPNPTRVQQPRQSLHNQRNLQRLAEQNAHTDAAASLSSLHIRHPRSSQEGTSNSVPQSHPMQGHNPFMPLARYNEAETLFRDMMFGSQGSTSQRTAERPELQWGSDTLFARDQGFVPPQHESSEALEKKRLAAMSGALCRASSNPNTRASSPHMRDEVAISAVSGSTNGNTKVQIHPATSHKKRKSKPKLEEEEEEEDDGDDEEDKVPHPLKSITKKRKSGVELNDLPGSSSSTQEAAGKRRKSGLSQSKPPRENLTEAQKRENHIKSEQKRRLAIKEGFEDLAFIIPSLKNGGYSKSSTLNIAGEWIESLVGGNGTMEEMLLNLNGDEEAGN